MSARGAAATGGSRRATDARPAAPGSPSPSGRFPTPRESPPSARCGRRAGKRPPNGSFRGCPSRFLVRLRHRLRTSTTDGRRGRDQTGAEVNAARSRVFTLRPASRPSPRARAFGRSTEAWECYGFTLHRRTQGLPGRGSLSSLGCGAGCARLRAWADSCPPSWRSGPAVSPARAQERRADDGPPRSGFLPAWRWSSSVGDVLVLGDGCCLLKELVLRLRKR